MGGAHARRPQWQIRAELRRLFLQHYDFDLPFQRAMRRLARTTVDQTPFWTDGESLRDAHDSATIMVPEAAARVRAYTAAVRALAAEVGLDRLESMSGIADSDGSGLIHAWITRRPHPAARFSGAPWVYGGSEPLRTLSLEAVWDPHVEDVRALRSRLRIDLDERIADLARGWQTGTRTTRRKLGDRDARFLFERVRFGWTYSRIARELGAESLGEVEIRQAVERFAGDAGVRLRENS